MIADSLVGHVWWVNRIKSFEFPKVVQEINRKMLLIIVVVYKTKFFIEKVYPFLVKDIIPLNFVFAKDTEKKKNNQPFSA